jgi:hypothetical protein
MYLTSLALACALIAADPHEKLNPVFEQLTEEGVDAGANVPKAKLPAPSLADGLDAAAQRATIEAIVGRAYTYEMFVRDSVVSPQIIRMPDAPAMADGQRLRQVDVWFIAYGDLDKIASKGFLGKLFGGGGGDAKGTALTAEDLAKHDIKIAPEAEKYEGYGHGSFELLEKVRLTGTTRSYWSRTDDSIVAAALLDPSFADDAEFPNYWQSITKGAGGAVLGAPNPYHGTGQYIKITRLAEPPGALLVECHVIYVEPKGWFDGTSLLASKLPAVMQNQVREMRKKLAAN